jgi:hypothetical protein
MGDKYENQDQTGAVGPGVHAHDINFKQVWNQISTEIDTQRLSEELTQLRLAMKKEAEIQKKMRFSGNLHELLTRGYERF